MKKDRQDGPLSVHMSQMLQFQDEVMMHVISLKRSDEIHMASFSKKPTEFLTVHMF
jgi:hypothetical protein